LVVDKIRSKKGEVKFAFCPTHEKIGHFLTKPLQGALFAQIQAKILNLPSSTGPTVHRSMLGE